ncbi:MAG: DUF1272 domain-containing protein [Pseudomonadota bacterium]
MLALRPSCEHCDKALPPDSKEAMICSYECTFCESCVWEILKNVCPNCGGGFWHRPVRPSKPRKGNNWLGAHPASDRVVHKPIDRHAHERFAATLEGISPYER